MRSGQYVSVIITTKNEEKVIGRLLQSIKNQTYRNFEIILVDNNSNDETVKIAKEMNVRAEEWGPERSAQRNFGVKKSRGKYLFFLDADMELSKNVLKECVKLMDINKNIAGITIKEESMAKNFWEKVKAFERSFYNLAGDEITDAARFFKKEVFLKVRGYDETITGPEDWDLTDRIKKKGYKIGIVSEPIFHYERIFSLLSLAKKKFYYGLKSHRYLSKNKVSLVGPKTIYFLRPIFYRRFDKFLKHPVLSLGMFIMLLLELVAGGLGYLIGRVKKF